MSSKKAVIESNSYLSVSTSTSFSGINRLLNGWFKALELAQQPNSSAVPAVCYAKPLQLSCPLVTDCPF